MTGDPNINPFAVTVYTDSRDRHKVSTCTERVQERGCRL